MIVIASPLTEPSLSNVTELLMNKNDDAIHRAIHTLMISNIVISVIQTAGILEREREREQHKQCRNHEKKERPTKIAIQYMCC